MKKLMKGGSRGSGKAKSYSPNFTAQNTKRKERADRKAVTGVKPGTPNRKCLHQKIVDNVVYYYHVTRGWKKRRLPA